MKIQALNRYSREMLLIIDSKNSQNITNIPISNAFRLIQWTGAYDINGTEIYSGAILKSNDVNSSFYSYHSIEVEYDNDHCGFRLSCNNIINPETGELSIVFEKLNCDIVLDHQLEVIGNINELIQTI